MKRRRRAPVRLKTKALWERLDVLGRSQNWLAAELGITPGYLSMLVNKDQAPSGRIRRRMQVALGVEDFHELFAWERDGENENE